MAYFIVLHANVFIKHIEKDKMCSFDKPLNGSK